MNPDVPVAARLAALPTLPMEALWALWDEHFPRRPSHPNRNYVQSRLAYRIQELADGALPLCLPPSHVWNVVKRLEAGAAKALQFYREELGRIMALCGCSSIAELDEKLIERLA